MGGSTLGFDRLGQSQIVVMPRIPRTGELSFKSVAM